MAFGINKTSAGLVAIATFASFGTAACGNSEAEATGNAGDTIKVTSVGLCTETQIYWAQEKGIFDDHNINVKVVDSTGGAAALAALGGKAVDIAYTSSFPALVAKSQGIDITWIATGTYTAESADAPTQTVVVPNDSNITTGKDLEGKKVAVNEIGGITQLVVERFISADGGDPATVEFVALPFPQIAGAVAGGTVDAGQLPADLAAANADVESIGDPYFIAADGKPFIGAGYAARADEAGDDQYEAFYDSIAQASEEINALSKEERIDFETTYCPTPKDVLMSVAEPPYDATTAVDAFAGMQDIALEADLLAAEVDLDTFIADYTKR